MRSYLFEDLGFLKTELFEISEFQEVICWIWYFPICGVLDTGSMVLNACTAVTLQLYVGIETTFDFTCFCRISLCNHIDI
jgi:hypothetical protein